ncbi:MAG: hypothetical protein R6T92_01500 [Desulfosalsimonadaceae bacterium]
MTRILGKILGILFFTAIVAGAIFFGLQYLSGWHEQEIQSALELQRKQFKANYDRLEKEIREVEAQLEKTRQTGSIPEERITEVFGKTEAETEAMGRCEFLKGRIDSFFDYLDKKMEGEKSSQELFFQMTAALAKKPPVVIGEGRDLITLLRNRAHFFRILRKERINMVRKMLAAEKDILEAAMADFYAYYISEDRCVNENDRQFMPMPVLYDYAGFFLETLSGKGYLMRRDSSTRSLALYYSVLILDRAIDNELNKYGIDIREHIDAAKDDIRNQRGLAYRERYLETLDALTEKYPQNL